MISRRLLLQRSLFAGSFFLSRHESPSRWFLPPTLPDDPFLGGSFLGLVGFSDEGPTPLNQIIGEELDGRLFTDFSLLNPERPVIPTSSFYIRTRASKLLDTHSPWSVQFGGLLQKPFSLPVQELAKLAQPMGIHLMECAGNSRSAHFGMLSVADWEGVPVAPLLERLLPVPVGPRVLVSGFDRYSTGSNSSTPGASWIFTFEQLRYSGAFLATSMNGHPLSLDYGAPIRLLVPGWYGCVCIKWVNEINLVADDTPATSQMLEYASRTLQEGIPPLARDFRPAFVDPAAMPVRIEKWSIAGKLKYRVVGIHWGGARPLDDLQIRFHPSEGYVPLEKLQLSSADSWHFWSHAWTPQKSGRYLISLRPQNSILAAKRLASGYYQRSVELTEV